MQYVFLLIENYLNGCDAKIGFVGVTDNAQYAYDWVIADTDSFITRETRQVPFITTP